MGLFGCVAFNPSAHALLIQKVTPFDDGSSSGAYSYSTWAAGPTFYVDPTYADYFSITVNSYGRAIHTALQNQIPPAQVPAPGTLLLILLGLAVNESRRFRIVRE
jgi:hypothetical protein